MYERGERGRGSVSWIFGIAVWFVCLLAQLFLKRLWGSGEWNWVIREEERIWKELGGEIVIRMYYMKIYFNEEKNNHMAKKI